jgi:uracil-DNA glycosylase
MLTYGIIEINHMTWDQILSEEQKKPYYKKLQYDLDQDRQNKIIYPPEDLIFNALNQTPLKDVKVVILGQDPYHNPNEACGLSFSVPENIKPPPSLKNIFKELEADLGIKKLHGNLESWTRQGVLLLNTSLTVQQKKPASHSNIGWHHFTNRVIQAVSHNQPFVVFILWGNHAQKKQALIDAHHAIVTSAHPSPLSAYRGFFGSKPFSTTNTLLKSNHLPEIMW